MSLQFVRLWAFLHMTQPQARYLPGAASCAESTGEL